MTMYFLYFSTWGFTNQASRSTWTWLGGEAGSGQKWVQPLDGGLVKLLPDGGAPRALNPREENGLKVVHQTWQTQLWNVILKKIRPLHIRFCFFPLYETEQDTEDKRKALFTSMAEEWELKKDDLATLSMLRQKINAEEMAEKEELTRSQRKAKVRTIMRYIAQLVCVVSRYWLKGHWTGITSIF